jgi:hypothetical protein
LRKGLKNKNFSTFNFFLFLSFFLFFLGVCFDSPARFPLRLIGPWIRTPPPRLSTLLQEQGSEASSALSPDREDDRQRRATEVVNDHDNDNDEDNVNDDDGDGKEQHWQ